MAFWHKKVCETCGLVVDKRHPRVKRVVVDLDHTIDEPTRWYEYYCGRCAPNYDRKWKKSALNDVWRYFKEFEVSQGGKPLKVEA